MEFDGDLASTETPAIIGWFPSTVALFLNPHCHASTFNRDRYMGATFFRNLWRAPEDGAALFVAGPWCRCRGTFGMVLSYFHCLELVETKHPKLDQRFSLAMTRKKILSGHCPNVIP